MTITLDKATIQRLAKDASVLAEFSFLRRFGVPTGTSCCGGSVQYPDASRAVQSILAMSTARKARFKELIGATRVIARVKRAARFSITEF